MLNWILLLPFKFSARRHFGFHDVIQLPTYTTVVLLPDNSGNPITSKKPNWRHVGNFKTKVGDNHTQSFVRITHSTFWNKIENLDLVSKNLMSLYFARLKRKILETT